MSGTRTDARVQWVVDPTLEELDGYTVVDWADLCTVGGWIDLARDAGMSRDSLESPAKPWFDWLAEGASVAVVNVTVDNHSAIEDLLGFAVAPAVRFGLDLVIGADRELPDRNDPYFVDARFGYSHALERLAFQIAGAGTHREPAPELPETPFSPDERQRAAVEAGEGVVQIIAPAGSGKSTVLVERVRELRRRGVPARAIACVTFNRAAADELRTRLAAAGVGDVDSLTFHGLGRQVMVQARLMRPDTPIGDPTLAQWRRLASIAKREAGRDGVFLDPGRAKEALSNIKLGMLLSADQYREMLGEDADPISRTVAALYRAHEALQREEQKVDFDDLILRAVLVLREQPQIREQWQHRYEHLLVDEYQDIEPAQEMLVQILAAPHDRLFCVGDEDQTLYAFRRASVERIIGLDATYPGLERIALQHNYRCPRGIVEASARLVAHNRVRFPKEIVHGGAHPHEGVIDLRPVTKQLESAGDIAQTLQASVRGQIVVLARTTNALRPVALACADRGVAIDGPDKLFTPTGARLALQHHLELLLAPTAASAELVAAVCRTPGRGLPRDAAAEIARRLATGATFADAFAEIEAPRRGRGRLLAPGELFTRLGALHDAGEAVALLRGPGGLDDWFEQADRMGGLDQYECEVLEEAQLDAAAATSMAFLARLQHQTAALAAIRDDSEGIELATIHGSKGRQWPHVILIAADEDALPHKRSLEVDAAARARGEGLEAERRLAYVALTRAGDTLEVHYDTRRPSRFLQEAGLFARVRRPRTTGAPQPAPPRPADRPPVAPPPPSPRPAAEPQPAQSRSTPSRQRRRRWWRRS